MSIHTDPCPTHLPDSALDPAPDGWDDYAIVCDAMHAANPHRFEGEL